MSKSHSRATCKKKKKKRMWGSFYLITIATSDVKIAWLTSWIFSWLKFKKVLVTQSCQTQIQRCQGLVYFSPRYKILIFPYKWATRVNFVLITSCICWYCLFRHQHSQASTTDVEPNSPSARIKHIKLEF